MPHSLRPSRPGRFVGGLFFDVVWPRARYATELLLESRWALFAAVDLMLVVYFLINVWAVGGTVYDVYGAVVLPILLLGPVAFSNVVAVERRAGSLDLALAVPSPEAYFVRRMLPIALFLVLQLWLLMALAESQDPWRALATALHSALIVVLLLCLALFWAVRLRSAGSVLLASLLSVLPLSPWIFLNPSTQARFEFSDSLVHPVLSFVGSSSVLGAAALLLYLYARVRLRRPETLLE